MDDFFQLVRRYEPNSLSSLRTLENINIRNDSGENLLHAAIAYSNLNAASDLIQRGIDVNAKNLKGATPLHYAGVYQIAAIAQLILDHGGNFEIADEHGNTPLWTAVFNARGKYDVVDVLLTKGARTIARLKNKHGRSPIDFAKQIGDTELVKRLEGNY